MRHNWSVSGSSTEQDELSRRKERHELGNRRPPLAAGDELEVEAEGRKWMRCRLEEKLQAEVNRHGEEPGCGHGQGSFDFPA